MPLKLDLSQLSILVIDDSRFMRKLTCEILHSFGVGKVRAAESSSEALKMLNASAPDIIICDWQMYPMDGLTLLKTLRQDKQSHLARIPFLMVTGHRSDEHVNAALGEGADSYVVKPYSISTLMAHLVKLIKGESSSQMPITEAWALD